MDYAIQKIDIYIQAHSHMERAQHPYGHMLGCLTSYYGAIYNIWHDAS